MTAHRHYYYDTPESDAGMRLDRLVRRLLPAESLSNIHRMIRSGQIQIGRSRAENNYRMKTGDVVVLPSPPAERRVKPPPAITKEWTAPKPVILREEAEWCTVNKPGGLSVQGGTGQGPWYVINWLKNRYPGAEFPPSPAHRLDLDTTGLLVVARTAKAARFFQAIFASRQVRKYYLALVEGVPASEHFTIDGPLYRATEGRIKMSVDTRGQHALTEVWRLSSGPRVSLVMASPHTGRTHQIRAHLASRGHPILLDERYGSTLRPPEALRPFERIYLHAWRLDIPSPDGPESGKRERLEAPPDAVFLDAVKWSGNRLPEIPWEPPKPGRGAI